MPVKCSSVYCTNNAILKRPKTSDALCRECFFWAFETEIHHTICKGKLFNRGETVAIAASGGKDSTVLAYVLKLLNEKYNYGLNLVLLSIDEGITGYRDDSLKTVEQNKVDYGLPLRVLSYEELYGWTMDAIVSQIGKKNNCTFCGVFRRQALDKGASILGVDAVATGHNADDIAETVIMNILRGDIARLQRCTAAVVECEGSIKKVKPLKYSYEKEIVMYAYLKQLVYFSTECIYAKNAYRGHARAFLKDIEKIRPSGIMDVIQSGVLRSVKKMMEGTMGKLPVESSLLLKPSLTEVARVLTDGMKANFDEVHAEVVDCPDLTKEPFNLVKPGLGGQSTLVEVGGPPYLMPSVNRNKIYDLKNVVELSGLTDAMVIGAGAGPWPHIGKNCEMMANCYISPGHITNGTHIAVLDPEDKQYSLKSLPSSQTGFSLLANLYCCSGLPSKVIKVHCKRRIGGDDFVSCMRKSLASNYTQTPVGLGGLFVINSGKARLHIMPDFSISPLDSEEKLNEWLKFFEMDPPLVAVGTLVSHQIPGLDLRLQHFHCFSSHNQGGHYHYDTTPQQAEYIGYFNVAEKMIRIDKPPLSHNMGRD